MQAPERTVYGTRIGAHWAFVVASKSDLYAFEGGDTMSEYPCEACGHDQMTLRRNGSLAFGAWVMVCNGCGEWYDVIEMPARQCNGRGE